MTQPQAREEAIARALLDELAHAQWDHPRTTFDEPMSNALPPEKLHALWEAIESIAGPFRAVESSPARVTEKGVARVVHVTCGFARLRKVLRITIDRDGKVAGLFYGPVSADIEAKTRHLIESASRGEPEQAARDFGKVMRDAMPAAKLEATWKAVEQQAGAWRSIEKVTLKSDHEYWSSLAVARFERDRLVLKVFYDAHDEVVGLFFVPASAEADGQATWQAPSYAKPDTFEERPVTVGSAPALPGTLAVPKGAGPFPAVVLIHGSGPSDEDESVGGFKVFKDLAWGLASRQIAVLRYTKRSRHAPAGIVTQKEEVLDAARDAVELLSRTERVDKKRIFVVGHSQGGNLAPRIAKENPAVAGLVVLAGSTRPIADAIIAQLTYLASLAPSPSPEAQALIDRARALKRTVEDPALRPDADVEFPPGVHLKGAYFLDARSYDAPAVAAQLSCPMLLLQGERDYQVTMEDFEAWRKALADKAGVVEKSYPTLNHLFGSGHGKPSPAEYAANGHVEAEVIDDIAAWISRTRL
jgi:uncharacterized protein